MDKLVSKLQYQDYETGEFTGVAARTLEETVELIQQYPWEKECTLLSVGVATAGVVIADASANYLKIGNYYHNQYCLYLYTHSGKYFIRIVETMEEVETTVSRFFSGNPVETDFNREHDLGIKKHFISKDFIREVTIGRVMKFMLFTIIASIPFTLLLIGFMGSSYFVGMFLIWLWVCGMNWVLFINYFLQSSRLFLKVSKGQNKFLFGARHNCKEYDKEDIESFIVYAWNGGSKGVPWVGFEVYRIIFKGGTEIRFTSLLISSLAAPFQFGAAPMKEVKKFFPFSRLGYVAEK